MGAKEAPKHRDHTSTIGGVISPRDSNSIQEKITTELVEIQSSKINYFNLKKK